MSKVFIKTATYDYDTLKPTIFEMLDAMGADLIPERSRVLIKPNLLLPAPPETAILTHPHVIRAVAEYVVGKGGRPLISDSPAMGSLEKIRKDGGYYQALKDLDVDFKAFKTSVKVDIGKPFGHIEIAREAVEADIVINLPKLKTHVGMLLTLGVKNLFGCIVGLRKPKWHLRIGLDRDMFARLLVQIYHAIDPSITIVDGILALEGQGPGKGGVPRHLGILAGGRNAVAVDMAICSMLGIDPDELFTHKAAKDLGLFGNAVSINGDFNIVDNFRLPDTGPLTLGPKPFHRFMRKHLLQRPEVDGLLCRLCGECRQYCPAKAITQDNKAINFDYDGCIRCYCCIEICPYGALRATETMPGKVLRKLSILK
ncbi:MAG: DUF362 domain-containing protein [Pseudomonadota bacterium]|nr:DUF362 domain-containing protein [Pseudomonadota bacterium]